MFYCHFSVIAAENGDQVPLLKIYLSLSHTHTTHSKNNRLQNFLSHTDVQNVSAFHSSKGALHFYGPLPLTSHSIMQPDSCTDPMSCGNHW